MAQLEALSQELESEDIHLDVAVKKYGKALALSSELLTLLTKTESEITVLHHKTETLLNEHAPSV